MPNDIDKVKKTLSLKMVFLTILIGITFVGILIYMDKSFTLSNFKLIKNIDKKYLILSLLLILTRDLLYILRIKLLVRNEISFINCFIIITMWEFASSLTPSAVGGGFIAILLFIHEGISVGRAIAYVMITATFDNYFFLIISPLGAYMSNFNSSGPLILYLPSYLLILTYSTIMTCSVFIKPEIFKYILLKITSIGFLKKYKENALKSAEDMVTSSKILKKYGFKFWILILIITLTTWLSRYLILNSLIEGFIHSSFKTHIEILSRHLVLWITMLISPTPGGSGVIEYIFNEFYHDILADYTIIVIILWRILTFYLYIFLGILILPRWLRTFKKRKNKDNKLNTEEIENIKISAEKGT